jgi:putative ABC transport system ATP-binding protein
VTVLQTENLGRAVLGAALVADVSLRVAQGERVVIVGQSGAGKSTLLRLLNRLDEPTTGTVVVNGADYRAIPPRQLRRTVGLVTQRPVMFPGTVADNVRFGPAQHGLTLPDERLHSLLSRVGLADFSPRRATDLSGGEAQRVALARVLANEPSILLLDEPTSALDEASKAGVESLICSLPVTCILVTHDMAQAHRMGTRIMTMEKGRLC